jgi:Sgf11 (transcriptional regulation protein)
VTCPVCYETVAGQRFAPHLEKCLNGGKRGGGPSKKSSLSSSCSTNNLGIGLPYYTAPKKIDPFPLSLVIRIRLKDGGKAFSCSISMDVIIASIANEISCLLLSA